jgi:subtilase family serine protease
MKKTIFILTFWLVQFSYASDKVTEYTEQSISGCNGISIFKTEHEILSVSSSSDLSSLTVSQDKDYIMVSSEKDLQFIVTTVRGDNYRVSFNSKSCQMPSKSYEGCFSKRQEITFKNQVKTLFYPDKKNNFVVSKNVLEVSNLKEKHKIIYIQELGQSIKPILLINKCS